mmetsp:Transcript_35084/g.91830  ORF Transcript_35084/g.91830 Transcript_35084/m.91830 type:complete len:334 (-) Transcript_35084:360-1361(-)
MTARVTGSADPQGTRSNSLSRRGQNQPMSAQHLGLGLGRLVCRAGQRRSPRTLDLKMCWHCLYPWRTPNSAPSLEANQHANCSCLWFPFAVPAAGRIQLQCPGWTKRLRASLPPEAWSTAPAGRRARHPRSAPRTPSRRTPGETAPPPRARENSRTQNPRRAAEKAATAGSRSRRSQAQSHSAGHRFEPASRYPARSGASRYTGRPRRPLPAWGRSGGCPELRVSRRGRSAGRRGGSGPGWRGTPDPRAERRFRPPPPRRPGTLAPEPALCQGPAAGPAAAARVDPDSSAGHSACPKSGPLCCPHPDALTPTPRTTRRTGPRGGRATGPCSRA